MNKLLLISLLAFNANAEFTDAEATFCGSVEKMASAIMRSRQAGLSMSGMIGRAEGNAIIISVIESAFEEPRWSSSEMIERAVEDFKNQAYKTCYDSLKD